MIFKLLQQKSIESICQNVFSFQHLKAEIKFKSCCKIGPYFLIYTTRLGGYSL